jgi:hypothetical protein
LLPRVLDAFAATYHYNAATDGTKTQFTKRKVIDYVRGIVSNYETQQAADAAAATQNATTATDLAVIT